MYPLAHGPGAMSQTAIFPMAPVPMSGTWMAQQHPSVTQDFHQLQRQLQEEQARAEELRHRIQAAQLREELEEQNRQLRMHLDQRRRNDVNEYLRPVLPPPTDSESPLAPHSPAAASNSRGVVEPIPLETSQGWSQATQSSSRSSATSQRPKEASVRGMKKLPATLQEMITPRSGPELNTIIPPSVFEGPLPQDAVQRRKLVTDRCKELYLKGQFKGFECLRSDNLFDEPSDGQLKDLAPAISTPPLTFCWSCGTKLQAGVAKCQKCDKPIGESNFCCSVPLLPVHKFCRKCGTVRVNEHCISCGWALGVKSKFCGNCGRPRNTPRPAQVCPCGNKLLPDAKVCRKCSRPVQKAETCECGAELRSDAKFCRACGEPRSGRACVNCNLKLTPEDFFCQQCGTRNVHAGAGEQTPNTSVPMTPLPTGAMTPPPTGAVAANAEHRQHDSLAGENAGRNNGDFFFHPALREQ